VLLEVEKDCPQMTQKSADEEEIFGGLSNLRASASSADNLEFEARVVSYLVPLKIHTV
jgi:hypothetical protein